MMMRFAVKQVALGLLFGVFGVLATMRAAATHFYGVQSYDPVSLVIAGSILTVAATVASFIPACRAASIEPVRALRAE
jgi:ABC-type antimicrobial peptide transport system permease subunit